MQPQNRQTRLRLVGIETPSQAFRTEVTPAGVAKNGGVAKSNAVARPAAKKKVASANISAAMLSQDIAERLAKVPQTARLDPRVAGRGVSHAATPVGPRLAGEHFESRMGTVPPVPTMSALDARWALAVRCVMRMEASGRGVLGVEDRSELVEEATRLGLQRFDAHLICATITQAVRDGQDPLGQTVVARLCSIRPAVTQADRAEYRDIAWGTYGFASLLGLLGAAALALMIAMP